MTETRTAYRFDQGQVHPIDLETGEILPALDIPDMLDQLADTRAQIDLLAIDKQSAIDSVLTDEIKAQLAAIDLEYAATLDVANERAAALEASIREAVIAGGQSVKAAKLHAIFSKRTNWDTKGLNGYAVAHPEITQFKSETESVSIRNVK